MDKDMILKLAESLGDCPIISQQAIPDIDLYMDQVTTFIEERLSHQKRKKDDKLLTKTMINNYSKAKVLPPSVKKKYTKEHIMLLVLLYYFKNIVSISDIESLLAPSIASRRVKEFYEAFEQLQSGLNDAFEVEIEKLLDKTAGLWKDEQSLDMVVAMALILDANMKKLMAERIIDNLNTKH